MPIVITWSGDRFVGRDGHEGERGTLVLGPMAMETMKRREGFVDLPPGSYRVEMQPMRNGTKALRVLPGEKRPEGIGPKAWESLSRGRIYIHPSNVPGQLEGCIAPGEVFADGGLAFSERSLWRLFVALGGWRIGYATELIIRG